MLQQRIYLADAILTRANKYYKIRGKQVEVRLSATSTLGNSLISKLSSLFLFITAQHIGESEIDLIAQPFTRHKTYW